MRTIIENQTIDLKKGRTVARFLKNGDLFELRVGDIMVNQVHSNVVDGSMNNIYLRIFDASGIHFTPLLGIHSSSTFSVGASSARWNGSWHGVAYDVLLTLTERDTWFWSVTIDGLDLAADLIYTQDLGLANPSAVASNEAYVSQYIDHLCAQNNATGYVLGSRQNQPQAAGNFPALRQGIFNRAAGYLTDGFQFYGLSYKKTNVPAALTQSQLPNAVDQYEFALAGLQSERIILDGEKKEIVIFADFSDNHPERLSEAQLTDLSDIRNLWTGVSVDPATETFTPVERFAPAKDIGKPLAADPLSLEDVQKMYPERLYEEWQDGHLFSFFTPDKKHIVLQAKELRTERPHGHILMSGQTLFPDDDQMATTAYLYGIFNSQVVSGNTSMNKMMSNSRNALNVLKTSGQRIYLKTDEAYHLLTLPSLFEMDFNCVRWFYKTKDDCITITTVAATDSARVGLTIKSQSGRQYNFLITQQILMNDQEYQYGFVLAQEGRRLSFRPDPENKLIQGAYPDLTFNLSVNGPSFRVSGDERLLSGTAADTGSSLVVLETDAASQVELLIQGSSRGVQRTERLLDAEKEANVYHQFMDRLLNGFRLSGSGSANDATGQLDTLVSWYAYDMLIHYLSPHGLEQYGGAAWGTRDVCQGPFEFFLAAQHFDVAGKILEKVYSHQYEDDGNWPQWFMFDRYSKIQFEESHGDIIVWPMKALADYLNATGDFSILDVPVPYMKCRDFCYTDKPVPLYDHLKKEVQYIGSHFLPGTHLSCYGNGDWDDTLQPADASMKDQMASSWTVALTYQAMRQLSAALESYDRAFADQLKETADKIAEDFRKYILRFSAIPGFLYFPSADQLQRIIYPGDTETGIDYRLLPMTRSMIAELVTKNEADNYVGLIRDHLKFPDGVRLMNKPARYRGGVSVHFKRAEQAANFGREIGLMYVHAHIRYIEAMTKIGHADAVWEALTAINPIGITDRVKNAATRQANAYFSSSDGDFRTRYEAQEHFGDLQTGKVQVKGGWRIYSSGPGILFNQIVTHWLGIRAHSGKLVIDPVLSQKQNDYRFRFNCFGKPATFVYHIAAGIERKIQLNGADIPFSLTNNPYRVGGMEISTETLREHLDETENVFDVFIPSK